MVSGPEDGAATVTETDPVSPAQTRAAFAYARTLLEADVADAAAEDALSAFRQAAPRPGDETLLALTRLMSAVSVPDRSSPADRRQAVWASIGHASHCTCRESAALLATRANGNIQPRESAALDEHLATCADCRELSVRAAEAEAAFRRELAPPKGPGGFGGLPSVPPTAYGALGVLIAIVIGAVLLLSGGSKSNSSKAAVAPVQTQASAQLRVAAESHPAAQIHTRVALGTRHKQKPVKPKTVQKPKVTHHVATTTTPVIPTSTPVTASTPVGDTGASGATTPSSVTNQPAAETAPAGSTAAQVSGSPSLPADSAPQQGIGSPTSTTP